MAIQDEAVRRFPPAPRSPVVCLKRWKRRSRCVSPVISRTPRMATPRRRNVLVKRPGLAIAALYALPVRSARLNVRSSHLQVLLIASHQSRNPLVSSFTHTRETTVLSSHAPQIQNDNRRPLAPGPYMSLPLCLSLATRSITDKPSTVPTSGHTSMHIPRSQLRSLRNPRRIYSPYHPCTFPLLRILPWPHRACLLGFSRLVWQLKRH